MEFKEFKSLMQDSFAKATKNQAVLFEVDSDKDYLWNLYLDSFPEGTNNMFRERREFDCSCCRAFIKQIGSSVVIKNNKVKSIWDFQTEDSTYQPVIDSLKAYIESLPVSDVYFSNFKKIGVDKNYEDLGDDIREWHHFFLDIPSKFVNAGQKSLGEIKGQYRDIKNVFKRSLDEILEESIVTILELISQNSLYKGEEWKSVLEKFLAYKQKYDDLPENEKENYAWEKSIEAGAVIGKIRNHSIGVLLVDISEGMDLDQAVRRYETIVAPTNYKRPKAIFTKQMLEEAKKKIEEMGFLESLNRRYAKLDDIRVNNILFSNKDSAKRIMGNEGIFDEMLSEVKSNPKKFSKVEEIPVNDFVNDVLPYAKEIELYLENKHSSSFVSLIAPENKDAPSMFKWDNAFSWAYSGNITDSSMKERVKSAGGNVEGVLRFSIQWNDVEWDGNDLDAHCVEPNGNLIYFGDKLNRNTYGNLDVDIVHPSRNIVAVENITWPDILKMNNGMYEFSVHNYSNRGGRNGFRAEVEFDGVIHSFDYSKELRQGERVYVANVYLENGTFRIEEKLPSNVSSREVWGLKTNQFVPVSVVCLSPNYWNQQDGIGHRHYFFMLKDCISPENPSVFYNEFLKEELMEQKRVFEALGGKLRVAENPDQLSGLGFSSTKRNELILKIKGQSERIVKIKF